MSTHFIPWKTHFMPFCAVFIGQESQKSTLTQNMYILILFYAMMKNSFKYKLMHILYCKECNLYVEKQTFQSVKTKTKFTINISIDRLGKDIRY